MSDEPQGDPVSSLGEMAIAAHEMFTEFINAGFTESQALTLIGTWLAKVGESGNANEG